MTNRLDATIVRGRHRRRRAQSRTVLDSELYEFMASSDVEGRSERPSEQVIVEWTLRGTATPNIFSGWFERPIHDCVVRTLTGLGGGCR